MTRQFKKLKASVLVSVIALFAVFFIFCGFAIDFSMIVATRSQLQNAVETAALSAVSEIPSGNAENTAREIFSYSRVNLIRQARITNIELKASQNAMLVEASTPAQIYFLSALGINFIEIQARAAAQIQESNVAPDKDFAIANQLQFTAPNIIFNKTGNEIRITRTSETSEYLTYVGLNDSINETKWVEITCASNDATAEVQEFDINAECVRNNNGDISAAKFIRVINNNSLTPLEVELSLINISKLIRVRDYNLL